MTANDRKRPLWSRCRLAAYSLHARARRRASSSFWPNHTPGLRIETTAVSTPALSMSSSDMATDHLLGDALLWLPRARAWTSPPALLRTPPPPPLLPPHPPTH